MKNFRQFPCGTNDAILMVTHYREGLMEGWLAHPRLDRPEQVKNIPQLLFLLDDLLSREDALISYHAFEPAKFKEVERIATIRIQILFREHHTWQGCLLWEDQKMEAPFLSVLEMIQIVN